MRLFQRNRWLFLLFVAGALLADRAAAVEPPPPQRVYIFRGAAGYWPGVHDMAERVRKQGFEPVVCRSAQLYWIKSQIVKRRQTGEETGPLLIIGYSLGAETAVKLAQGLDREGIKVDGLLLIEPYNHPKIPPNVDYCFNFFESRKSDRWFIFRGTPVSEVTSKTSLLEVDVAKDEKFSAEMGFLNHFNIQDDPRVQDLVAGQLRTIH